MRALYLLRHSLTAANEARQYCGRVDPPLSPNGRALAERLRRERPLPPCDVYVTSGMARADETLRLLTGHAADVVLPDLREMDFGAFELRRYEELRDDPDYQRWIADARGEFPCPGGESTGAFRARALRGGAALLALPGETAIAVCHGGVIVQLMGAWFPGEDRHYYQWQPGPCGGWRVEFDGGCPIRFEAIREA